MKTTKCKNSPFHPFIDIAPNVSRLISAFSDQMTHREYDDVFCHTKVLNKQQTVEKMKENAIVYS